MAGDGVSVPARQLSIYAGLVEGQRDFEPSLAFVVVAGQMVLATAEALKLTTVAAAAGEAQSGPGRRESG